MMELSACWSPDLGLLRATFPSFSWERRSSSHKRVFPVEASAFSFPSQTYKHQLSNSVKQRRVILSLHGQNPRRKSLCNSTRMLRASQIETLERQEHKIPSCLHTLPSLPSTASLCLFFEELTNTMVQQRGGKMRDATKKRVCTQGIHLFLCSSLVIEQHRFPFCPTVFFGFSSITLP